MVESNDTMNDTKTREASKSIDLLTSGSNLLQQETICDLVSTLTIEEQQKTI